MTPSIIFLVLSGRQRFPHFLFLNLYFQKHPRRVAANFTKTSLDECLELLASPQFCRYNYPLISARCCLLRLVLPAPPNQLGSGDFLKYQTMLFTTLRPSQNIKTPQCLDAFLF